MPLSSVLRAAMASVILSLVFVQSLLAQSPNRIEWQTDLKTAYNLARDNRKPLVVFVFGEDERGMMLPSCQAMDSGALASPELQWYRESLVFVRVCLARDDEQGTVVFCAMG